MLLLLIMLRFLQSISFDDSQLNTVSNIDRLSFSNTMTRLVAHCLVLLYKTSLLNVFVINANCSNYKMIWDWVHSSQLELNLVMEA